MARQSCWRQGGSPYSVSRNRRVSKRLPSQSARIKPYKRFGNLWTDAGGDGGYRFLCIYLAATPDMFEGPPEYFPRYDALQTRIQPLGPENNGEVQ